MATPHHGSDLDGVVALVVGAARGIGAACARHLGLHGASVVAADRDLGELERTVDDLRADGITATGVHVDVRSSTSVNRAVRSGIDGHGRLDIAVNSAAVAAPSHALTYYPEQTWLDVIDVNLSGVFRCVSAQLQVMTEQQHGSIVNISSVLGHAAHHGAAAYVSAKHGVEGLTRSAALEGAPVGVRVNSVAPGFISTPLLEERRTPDERKNLAARHPLGRLGRTEEVAALVTFLASEAGSYVTGSCYRVDGGYLTALGR